MEKDRVRVRVVGDDGGRVATALAQGRFELVNGKPDDQPDVELIVRRSRRTVDLTPRELEVLRLLAAGVTNLAIGDQLFIAENTVKNHVRSILEKLGAQTRTQAVVLAHRQGLVDL